MVGKSVSVNWLSLALLFRIAAGFLFDTGPQCYDCETAFSPHSCSETSTCLLDQECSTERFLTSDGTQAYRLGCLSKSLCRFSNQPTTDTECVRCCAGQNCNKDLCMKDTCLQGYYGPSCTDRCGHCFNGTQCDKETGQCVSGCEADYLEPFCDTKLPSVCRPKFYGPYCTEVCGHCANGDNCDKTTGKCPTGCDDGFLTPFCHTACTKPWYGPECRFTCGHCADGACRPGDGICEKGCEPGFLPPLCSEELWGNNCTDVKQKVNTSISGMYLIAKGGGKVNAWCDMTTNGTEWIVFQRRMNASVDFNRPWEDYKHGFGDMSGSFWWGNDNLAALTSNGHYLLRVDLEDVDGNRTFAEYLNFFVANEQAKYRLQVGTFRGTASDGLSFQNGAMFSTIDQDNDGEVVNCSKNYPSGWWFKQCFRVNLNGFYLQPGTKDRRGIEWNEQVDVTGSLKWTEMKFRSM